MKFYLKNHLSSLEVDENGDVIVADNDDDDNVDSISNNLDLFEDDEPSNLPMEEYGDNPMPQFDEDCVEIIPAVDPTIDFKISTGNVGGGATEVGLDGSAPTRVGVAFSGSVVNQLVDDINDPSRVCLSQ